MAPTAPWPSCGGWSTSPGPGLFQPLEQEGGPGHRRSGQRGLGSAPVLRRAAIIGAAEFAAVVAGRRVAAWPLGLDSLLDHQVSLLAALILSLMTFAGAELVRGVLSGRHFFGRYGWYFAAEGGGPAGAGRGLRPSSASGPSAPTPWPCRSPSPAGALVAVGRDRPFVRPGPPAAVPGAHPRPRVPARSQRGRGLHAQRRAGGRRNPGPVGPRSARLLPERLDNRPGFRCSSSKRSRPACCPLWPPGPAGATWTASGRCSSGSWAGRPWPRGAAAAAAALAGPWIVETAFGDVLGRRDMTLMALSSGGLMIMLSLALGLVALGHVRLAAIGWAAGVAAFPPALAPGRRTVPAGRDRPYRLGRSRFPGHRGAASAGVRSSPPIVGQRGDAMTEPWRVTAGGAASRPGTRRPTRDG